MGSDSEAIARSLRRASAFEGIFERHFEVVYRYLRRQAGAAAAEDLAAETFARAFSARASYDLSYDDARPWLLGIATNVLRAHQRSNGRVTIPLTLFPPVPEDDNAERAAHYRGWTLLRKRIRGERRVLRYLWPLVPVSAAVAVLIAVLLGGGHG